MSTQTEEVQRVFRERYGRETTLTEAEVKRIIDEAPTAEGSWLLAQRCRQEEDSIG